MGKKVRKEGETEHGTVLLKASGDQNAFSHDGDEYEVSKDGVLEVPTALKEEAMTHGFLPIPKAEKAGK